MMKTIGVLALQGAVSEHVAKLNQLGVRGVAVKEEGELAQLDGLIIPGGESTAISRLITQHGLYGPIQAFAKHHPVMGTCAGLILCAKEIVQGDAKVKPLNLIDITVERNGFGRQIDSFECTLPIEGVGVDVPAVFIRAPFIESVGAGVNVLTSLDGKVVMAESGYVLVMAFHPELAEDSRILEYFINKL